MIPTNGFTGRRGGVAGQPENSHGVTVDFMYFSPCSALIPRLRYHFTQLFVIVSAASQGHEELDEYGAVSHTGEHRGVL